MCHVKEVVSRLKQAGLTFKISKIKFATPELSILSHIVSLTGVSIDPDRTAAMRNYPPPSDIKVIVRYIGMINFFNKFIPDLSQRAAPLNQLRKKGVKFIWSDE
jgi:hypothetical protein